MWLDDVISHTTIRSVWGNGVRNQLVQVFDTVAERDSHTATLPNGSLCWVLATGLEYVKLAGAWRLTRPQRFAVAGAGGMVGGAQPQIETARYTVPAGYTRAQVAYTVFLDSQGIPGQTAIVQVYTGNGGVKAVEVHQYVAVTDQLGFSFDVAVNPAGDLITVGAGIADTANWYMIYSDPLNHQLSGALWP